MFWSMLSFTAFVVLISILLAEATNGASDSPVGTSAAVASGVLTKRQALLMTAFGNFFGLIAAIILGAKVAETIGTGIVRADLITIESIGIAMVTSIAWASIAVWLGWPISKTHSLLASLAGIGFAYGGIEALLPVSGDWLKSGWIPAAEGVLLALVCGSAASFFLASVLLKFGLDKAEHDPMWRKMQIGTVCLVATGHGFNDGLKYVGIFTLVLYKSGMIPKFYVMWEVIVLCAIVMGIGTMIGGWRIHRTLDGMVNQPTPANKENKKTFRPYMGVCTELVSGLLIWISGALGIPMSTNHGVVSAMAGAKSAGGKVHSGSIVKILWGWVITYLFCFLVAKWLTTWFLIH
jgi:PiT family inorganic phosphate transporter